MSGKDERSKAHKFIDDLCFRRSGGSEAHRQKLLGALPPEHRAHLLLQGFDEARQALGNSVITLSKDLYTKRSHFIYELIQNADDNKYTRSEEEPFLQFIVTSDRITIDSNEDGFEEKHVDALCDVGASTKQGQSGYIGEKGIGFKSVFKVAKRVTIQSGPFYFYIDHDENSLPRGMDMITPHNVHPDPQSKLPKLPAEVRTRIVLDLQNQCDMEQFKSLTTVLLFLRKLTKLSIRLESDGSTVEEMQYSITKGKEQAEITVVHDRTESKRRFLLETKTIDDMPSHKKRLGRLHADVLLAFPVDENDVPVQASEHIYAFLPLFRIGFPFLIQSDFITSANRENVDGSKWNRRLRKEITELFMQKLEKFAKHPTLKYAWVRFIPVDTIVDDFWGDLHKMLLARLRESDVFRTLSGGLRRPGALRKVLSEYCDADERPLLPDLPAASSKNAYMSNKYHPVYEWPKLGALGARDLSASDFTSRLESMLESTTSRMNIESANSDWHIRLANALLTHVGNKDILRRLKWLPLIPLSKGGWAAPQDESIYFPKCGGIEVPIDLVGLDTVQQAAFDVPERRRLFKKLGVCRCDPITVADKIEGVYTKGREWDWEQHISHIKFLYWHHTRLAAAGKHVKLKIAYFEEDELKSTFPSSSKKWIYDEMEDESQAGDLLADKDITERLADDVIMFSSRYHGALEDLECRHGLEVIPWLHQMFDVRESIEIHQSESDFSEAIASREFTVLAEQYPELLLSMLEPHKEDLVLHRRWKPIISRMTVPILHSDVLKPLNATFMPRSELLTSVKALDLEKDFGFIEELAHEDDSSWSDWSFLEKFGVKHKMDLQFWLYVLRHAAEQNSSVTNFNKIFAEMQRFYDEADTIKSALNANPLIPWRKTRYLLKDCIWADDDIHLPGKASIACEFEARRALFVDHLGVPLPSLKMHVDALVQRSTSSSFSKEEALDLMHNICIFRPDRASVKALLKCPIFPVRTPTSQMQWMKSADEFYILDRTQHRQILGDRVSHLGFTIEELHKIEPLLAVLELRSRLSSRIVEESTAVRGSTHEGHLTMNLRSKAYAICRFAAHGYSPRCANREGVRRMFETLRSIEGHQSDNITKVYQIKNAEKGLLSIPANKADCHVEETETLSVYISRDTKRRHICITNELPRRLLGHLGVVKDNLVHKLGAVLSASSLDDVDELLEQYGIIRLEGVSRPDRDELTDSHLSLRFASLRLPGSESVRVSREGSPAATSPAGNFKPLQRSHSSWPRSSSAVINDQLRTPEASPRSNTASRSSALDETLIRPFTFASPTPTTPAEAIKEQYRQLVDFIATASRQPGLSTLPRSGATSRSSISPPNDMLINKALLASNRSERDKDKIGAAGELLVFEILNGLGLRFFSEYNWQSKKRGCVNVHENYKNFANWPGLDETSDIVYDDTYFKLYNVLRDLGYLDTDEPPKRAYRFEIEVKTTASLLETPFFMSEKQVELMNDTAPKMFSLEKIFIIARVFNLGQADMGLKLYMDPAKLRRDGGLIFESSYKVRPAR